MKIFDLHCDTLLKKEPLAGNTGAIDLDRLPAGALYCQTFAMFVHDRYRGEAAVAVGEDLYSFFQSSLAAAAGRIRQVRTMGEVDQAFAAGETAALLSVENATLLDGRLERLERLAARGVRLVGLTWNAANELGGGADAPADAGLTAFGKEAIRRMEELGIVVDVSHANERTFWDAADWAVKPILASHSNARAICAHRRNLSDSQIRRIAEGGGIIGLNYYLDFLRDDKKVTGWDDLLRHIEHILNVGGPGVLALGSDFDGAASPDFLVGPQDLPAFYEAVSGSSLGRDIADRLFFDNAGEFFRRNLPA
ncbi:MAG: membrane dipeptidase [Peptococcaceae bacterium]|nr:membrane dipeptidase [Peptococcaceae bacterium]